jgi:hypothetical protein
MHVRAPAGKMTALEGIGLAMTVYLALLARSAWKQGETRQFIMSCLVLVLLFGAVAAIVAAYIWWQGG